MRKFVHFVWYFFSKISRSEIHEISIVLYFIFFILFCYCLCTLCLGHLSNFKMFTWLNSVQQLYLAKSITDNGFCEFLFHINVVSSASLVDWAPMKLYFGSTLYKVVYITNMHRSNVGSVKTTCLTDTFFHGICHVVVSFSPL